MSKSDTRELKVWRNNMQRMIDDKDKIMHMLVMSEGVVAVGHARRIATSENIVNTGDYRRNFHAGSKESNFDGDDLSDGSKPRISGNRYEIDFYNNLAYAKHLEFGFRRHFVPGRWQGTTFVHDPKAKGGMMVPARKAYQPGNYIHFRALRATEKTQQARLKRKLNDIIKLYLDGGSI